MVTKECPACNQDPCACFDISLQSLGQERGVKLSDKGIGIDEKSHLQEYPLLDKFDWVAVMLGCIVLITFIISIWGKL